MSTPRNKKAGLTLGSAVMVTALFFAGCTPMASQEQLAELDALNAEIQKLRRELSDCNNEKASLQSQVATAENRVKQLQDDKAFVERGLATFKPAVEAPKKK